MLIAAMPFSFLFACMVALTTPTSTFAGHDFHMSKCDIYYNREKASLEIVLHLFIDDTEEALKSVTDEQLRMCTKDEHSSTPAFLKAYLNQKLRLTIDGNASSYKFLGKEVSEDLMAIWCYLEVENVPQINSIEIRNDIMLELFDDQKNIVSFKGEGGFSKFLVFQHGEIDKSFTLQ